MGILIPPSIVMVVYSAATNVSVGRMFLGGVVPGLLAGLMLIIAIYITARIKNLPKQPFVGWKEALKAAKEASWGLLLVVIILGGIYGGIFTPTEAAAVAAVYSFFIANFIYRDMGPFADKTNTKPVLVKVVETFVHKDTKATLYDAGKLTIMLMFIIANALILKHVLTEERIPQMITESMLSAGLGPITFLIVVNLILLVGGQFMEPSGLLVIVAPLVFPIAIALGIDPIHLGIMMVVNMEIGMITPPVGLNLFVTSGVAKMSMMNVVKAALPWVGVMFLFLIIVTYVPWVSTWLPTLLMGPEIITR
ncbi:TRAP-type C4-dicarboxylate transport system%2C large permease component [Vibrio cholerae]|nr:TRAP-type C4-dicarboxylate transport system%2C large permease component [Vibrio cholerae]